jgi:hypothetical protein
MRRLPITKQQTQRSDVIQMRMRLPSTNRANESRAANASAHDSHMIQTHMCHQVYSSFTVSVRRVRPLGKETAISKARHCRSGSNDDDG